MPSDLQKVGQEASQNIQGKFDQLEESVNNKQNELIDSLAQKYSQNVQEIDADIEKRKTENKGIWDKAKDAIAGTIQTIAEIKAMLEGVLADAAGAVGKILLDPIAFLGNLATGLRQGLENFVGNIGTHLQTGLVAWLTGTMGSMGIQIPEDIFSLQGIFSLVTQILGVTWDFIRGKAVKMFGPKVVAGMEESVDLFQILQKQGPIGLWQHVQEHFSDLKEQVIDQIKEMVITQVIQAGVTWILSLLTPASAFVKAAKAIYDIVMFFVNRGSQIIELVQAVTQAVSAIASGAVAGAAKLVESALAKALPVAIGFLAALAGVGGLAEKVQKIVQKIKKRIDDAIEKVLEKVKKLFKGGKGKGNKDKSNKDGKPDERTIEEKKADVHQAVVAAENLTKQKDATPDTVKVGLPAIQSKYRLNSIALEKDYDRKYYVEAQINPKEKKQMPELEVVANIEDFVKGAEPAIAKELMASVKTAKSSQKKAQEVYEILKSGKLVKPKMSSQKTIAISEDTAALSGWGSLNSKWKKAISEKIGLSLEQDESKVREYYENHRQEFAQYGYQTRDWALDPEDDLGKHYRSHAEKQISVIKPSPSIGVSRSVCKEDCYPYLHALAQVRKQNIVVADPDGVWVFYTNGEVKFAYHK